MRLFFALPLPDALADHQRDLRARAESRGIQARWPHPEGLHLTLAFLGEGPQEALPRLEALGHAVASCHAAFALRTGGLAGFPTASSSRILYLGIERNPSLEALAGALRRALLTQGTPFDAKPFRPHITLARPAPPVDATRFGPAPAPLAIQVKAFHLYASISGVEGPRYDPIITFPLEARCCDARP
nr:RNA 2',3'-cyclic phosphodiesterase [uncultured Holophaga sp.]